jgi:hypothetical protein
VLFAGSRKLDKCEKCSYSYGILFPWASAREAAISSLTCAARLPNAAAAREETARVAWRAIHNDLLPIYSRPSDRMKRAFLCRVSTSLILGGAMLVSVGNQNYRVGVRLRLGSPAWL